MEIKVVCFYTVDTPYQQEVIHLQNSCTNLGIPIEVEPVHSEGSWEENVAKKPRYILEKLESSSLPILWVDADAVFLKKPDFSFLAQVDFSVRFMEIFQNDPTYAVNAATVFINQTKEARSLMKKWVKRCEELRLEKPLRSGIDQISLYEVLLKNKKAKVLPLPAPYCKIYDLDTFFVDDDQVIIEQRQASRIYKAKI